MTESESVALPLGDAALFNSALESCFLLGTDNSISHKTPFVNTFLKKFYFFLKIMKMIVEIRICAPMTIKHR